MGNGGSSEEDKVQLTGAEQGKREYGTATATTDAPTAAGETPEPNRADTNAQQPPDGGRDGSENGSRPDGDPAKTGTGDTNNAGVNAPKTTEEEEEEMMRMYSSQKGWRVRVAQCWDEACGCSGECRCYPGAEPPAYLDGGEKIWRVFLEILPAFLLAGTGLACAGKLLDTIKV